MSTPYERAAQKMGEREFLTWDAWHDVHQPFELGWWEQHRESITDPVFSEHWGRIRDWIAPVGRVLDIGCGPRPPFRPCAVIEPLALRYVDMVDKDWWEGIEINPHPAEWRITKYGSAFDTVICWNAIDHLIGWRDVLENMAFYAQPSAKIALATDFYQPFLGHPGVPKRDFMAEIERLFVVERVAEPSPCGRALALSMRPAWAVLKL